MQTLVISSVLLPGYNTDWPFHLSPSHHSKKIRPFDSNSIILLKNKYLPLLRKKQFHEWVKFGCCWTVICKSKRLYLDSVWGLRHLQKWTIQFLTLQVNIPEVADSLLSSANTMTAKQYSTLNFFKKSMMPRWQIWQETEGLKSHETSHHGQWVQFDHWLTRMSPLRSAGSQNHRVKCCVPVRNGSCFGRYTQHNSSGWGRSAWRMEKWQSGFFWE